MPTPNFGLPLYTTADTAALDVLLNGQSNAIDTALLASEGYVIGTDAQRLALTAPRRKEGLKWYSTDTNIGWFYNGTAWRAWESDWITYTATLTNFTVGSSGQIATTKYRYTGGMVEVRFYFVYGATAGSISGPPRFTLPVTAAGLDFVYQDEGEMIFRRVTTIWPGKVVLFSTTVAQMAIATQPLTDPSNTAPWGSALAAGDTYRGSLLYIPA